jgi:hypothetical protein
MVLVLGGLAESATFLDSADVYDPTSDSWHPAGQMHGPAGEVRATLLADGRVLVVDASAAAAIYSANLPG